MNEHVANETRTEIAGEAGVFAEVTAFRERLAVLEESLRASSPSQRPRLEAKPRVWKRTGTRLAAGALLTVLAGATVVYGADALDALFIGPDGKVGIGTTTPVSRLTINEIKSIGQNKREQYADAPLTVFGIIPNGEKKVVEKQTTETPTSNILNLVREGVSGESWPNMASFALGRFDAVKDGVESRTRLDIKLTDGAFDAHKTIMTLRSDGNVGVGTTAPIAPLEVKTTTGKDDTKAVTDFMISTKETPEKKPFYLAASLIGGSSPKTRSVSLETGELNVNPSGVIKLQRYAGSVAIGTRNESPDEDVKLQVGGTVKATTVKTTTVKTDKLLIEDTDVTERIKLIPFLFGQELDKYKTANFSDCYKSSSQSPPKATIDLSTHMVQLSGELTSTCGIPVGGEGAFAYQLPKELWPAALLYVALGRGEFFIRTDGILGSRGPIGGPLAAIRYKAKSGS